MAITPASCAKPSFSYRWIAGAHFELARAMQAAKRTDDARNEVLAALEMAPNFKPAQKLLLELSEKD